MLAETLGPIFLQTAVLVFFLSMAMIFFVMPTVKSRKIVLLAGSIFFYFQFAGFLQFSIIIILSLITFYFGLIIEKSHYNLIYIPIFSIVLVLISSKLILAGIGNSQFSSLWIPLGVSFFTFEFIHYLVEIRRGQKPETSLFDFLSFSFFSPTVVSGPIRRYVHFHGQIENLSKPKLDDFISAISTISLGFLYKFMADQSANFQSIYHDAAARNMRTSDILMLMFISSIRIFFDFAGYSLIAIGLSRLFGIRIPRNFNAPYLSLSIIEFWDRWHISLSSWVRDYIYIVLGGSRRGFFRQVTNLMICMSVIGLWHGFGLNFLFWGLLQGLGLSVNHAYRKAIPRRMNQGFIYKFLSRIFRWFATLLFVGISWLYFFYETNLVNSMVFQLFRSVGGLNT
jgi:alginate O-acetyltransferase complex protein AlgI